MRDHWWWRPGWETGRRFYTWHLTFDGQEDVHRAAAAYRDGLAHLDGLTLIPDPWLHLTMQGIGFVDEVDAATVDQVVAAAGARLAAVPAFEIQLGAGPVVLDPEAILLPALPSEPVHAVRDAVRAAIGDVLPEVPEQASGFRPHVSVAYSAGTGPVAPIAEALDALDVPAATARITFAELIVLGRDRQMYEWETYARVPLGASA
ncbi:2'-5' RNA ligase family protein [Streptomyces sp. NPDC002308]